MEVKFEVRDGELYIDGKKVIKGWETFNGWYWFAVEKVRDQISIIDGKEVPDTIWYGLVQGFEDEWGYFSEAEIKMAGGWEINKKDLPFAGRRR